MRRTHIAPLLLASAVAGSLAMSACTSNSSAPRTVIVTNTVTGGSSGAGSSTATGATTGSTGSTVVVVPPSGTGKATPTPTPVKTTAKTTSKPTTPAKTTAPAFQKVDPLTADCAMLLSQADVKKALGATIPSGSVRVRDVADPGRGVTGKIRCRFGSTDGGKSGRVTVLLTKYATAGAAAKQVALTKSTEQDLGAKSSATTVDGYPAQILLRDGGLVTMQYDSWTMSVVAAKGLAPDDRLTGGLPVLASQVLTRIVKNG